MAHQGFDSLTVDMQHGVVDYQIGVSMLQGISTTGVIPLARVPWNDPARLMKILDAGAYGVTCPMVNTREQAEALVQACKYPPRGYRFNPHKLLLDPYARLLSGPLRWTDALFGYRVNSPRADLSFDRRDSVAGMLKAVVTDDMFDWGDDRPPNVPWSNTVIYEAHLRGLTMLRNDIRPNERGTFAGS